MLLQANYHGDIASFILDACHTAAIQISEKVMLSVTYDCGIESCVCVCVGLSTSEATVTTAVTVGHNQWTFQTEEDICKCMMSRFKHHFFCSTYPASQ